MRLNAGIITKKLKETKEFYTKVLGLKVKFENEWYLLLETPKTENEIAFLLPNLPTQASIFQKKYSGEGGVYFTIEVDNVDHEYEKIKKLDVKIVVDIKNEEWGDRHFAIVDPNGIGIDIVTYSKPE